VSDESEHPSDLASLVFEKLLDASGPPVLQGIDDGSEPGPVALTVADAIGRACSDLLSHPEIGPKWLATGSPAQLLQRLGVGPPHAKDAPLTIEIRRHVEMVYWEAADPGIESALKVDRLLSKIAPPQVKEFRGLILGTLADVTIEIQFKDGVRWRPVRSVTGDGAKLLSVLYDSQKMAPFLSHKDIVRYIRGPEELVDLSGNQAISSVAHQIVHDVLYRKTRAFGLHSKQIVEAVRGKGYKLRLTLIDRRGKTVTPDEPPDSRPDEALAELTAIERQVVELLAQKYNLVEIKDTLKLTDAGMARIVRRIQDVTSRGLA
jgi:hypothetical protein